MTQPKISMSSPDLNDADRQAVIDEMSTAMGTSQMNRLDEIPSKREQVDYVCNIIREEVMKS